MYRYRVTWPFHYYDLLVDMTITCMDKVTWSLHNYSVMGHMTITYTYQVTWSNILVAHPHMLVYKHVGSCMLSPCIPGYAGLECTSTKIQQTETSWPLSGTQMGMYDCSCLPCYACKLYMYYYCVQTEKVTDIVHVWTEATGYSHRIG